MRELKNQEWLSNKANELRIEILKMVNKSQGGHIGGAYSVIDVMTALYFNVLNYDPKNPSWSDRDRLVFSKGHGCLALYTVLAEVGYFGKENLDKYCVDEGLLGGHPERGLIPGVEVSSGSLGHGVSFGVGMALAAKIDKKQYKTYVVISDGELNEGSTWEGFMAGAQFKLDNLTVIIDSNKHISLGRTEDIMNVEPLPKRLESFGWNVQDIDGHSMSEILNALDATQYSQGKPNAIVANTIKGKGVSFMENATKWHYRRPKGDEFPNALAELEALLK
ncbi:transketolase [Candidatus Woesearchaeota archaeon]|nr:transketolase [Candidatus Woesearchaeota archaeon]